jgi:hypothetical protein
MSPLQAIRRKCLDCAGGQYLEVKLCEAVACPLWPFRSGSHPYTKTRLLQADGQESAANGSDLPAAAAMTITPLQQPSSRQGSQSGTRRPVTSAAAPTISKPLEA